MTKKAKPFYNTDERTSTGRASTEQLSTVEDVRAMMRIRGAERRLSMLVRVLTGPIPLPELPEEYLERV